MEAKSAVLYSMKAYTKNPKIVAYTRVYDSVSLFFKRVASYQLVVPVEVSRLKEEEMKDGNLQTNEDARKSPPGSFKE